MHAVEVLHPTPSLGLDLNLKMYPNYFFLTIAYWWNNNRLLSKNNTYNIS